MFAHFCRQYFAFIESSCCLVWFGFPFGLLLFLLDLSDLEKRQIEKYLDKHRLLYSQQRNLKKFLLMKLYI
jgi:hypothetical protein